MIPRSNNEVAPGNSNVITRVNSAPRWTRPLRVYLGLVMVLLLIAVSGVLIALDYQRGRNAAIGNASDRMRAFSRHLIDRFQILVGEPVSSVELASVSDVFASPPPAEMDAKLGFLRKVAISPRINGIYVGYPNGDFVHAVNLADEGWRSTLNPPRDAAIAIRVISRDFAGERISRWQFLDIAGKILKELPPSPATYDPRERPWYRAAVEGSTLVATAPYTMATTGAFGLTIAKVHNLNSGIVIGVDVLLGTVSEFLSNERISKGSTVFVLDAYRNPIIHSDPDVMKALTTLKPEERAKAEFTDPLIRAAQIADLPENQIRFLSIGGRDYIVMATALGAIPLFSGDRVVLGTPLDELTVDAQRGLIHGIEASIVVVLAGVACALLFAHWITRALASLTLGVRRLHELDFETPVEVRSRVKEISALAAAMTTARTTIGTFGLYVPKELVRRIIVAGDFARRGAKREDVTALFTDIYDFTTISERHTPEEVVAMLSDYFDIFSETVAEYEGAIIQFLGDSVFAMWNVPLADPKHALHACECALALQTRLEDFNIKKHAEGLPEFRTRFGIHTGTAVVGSVGAKERLQYTGMGDTVNVASRLEGINKDFHTTILVSDAVKARCGDKLSFRPLGRHKLKGRDDVIEIFELVREENKKL
jgi:adenylate cyclase